jgi:hypothetical protein
MNVATMENALRVSVPVTTNGPAKIAVLEDAVMTVLTAVSATKKPSSALVPKAGVGKTVPPKNVTAAATVSVTQQLVTMTTPLVSVTLGTVVPSVS